MTISDDPRIPLTNACVQLSGHDGNAFAIVGRVRRAIVQSDHPELAEAFIRDATAGDYDTLLQACMRYVSVE